MAKRCSRYTFSGDLCRNETVEPDGWCRRCAGRTELSSGGSRADSLTDDPATHTSSLREVYASSIPTIEDRVARFNTLAAELGVDARAEMSVSNHRVHERDDKTVVPVCDVTVHWQTIRLPGNHQFVGVVRHGGDINAVHVPGEEPDDFPESYRSDEPTCDHCGVARDRNQTLVVRSETGRYLRVGTTCARKYLGLPGDRLVKLMDTTFSEDFIRECDEETGRGGTFTPSVESYIAIATYVVRRTGYQTGGGTRDVVEALTQGGTKADDLFAGLSGRDVLDSDERDDATFAADALEWARSYDGNNKFLLDMKAYATNPMGAKKGGGLLAYLPEAYAQHLSTKKTADLPASKWVGTRGQKIEPVEVEIIKTHISPPFARGGPEQITFTCLAADGTQYRVTTNVETKFAQTVRGLGGGEKFLMVGTVKGHVDYRSGKQTEITRASTA